MKKLTLALAIGFLISACGGSQHGDPTPNGPINPNNYLRLSNGQTMKLVYGAGTVTSNSSASTSGGNSTSKNSSALGGYHVGGHAGQYSYALTEVGQNGFAITPHVGGYETPADRIPTAGVAYYRGSAFIPATEATKDFGAEVNDGVRSAKFDATVDFGAKTITGRSILEKGETTIDRTQTQTTNVTNSNGTVTPQTSTTTVSEPAMSARVYEFKAPIVGAKYNGVGTVKDADYLLIGNGSYDPTKPTQVNNAMNIDVGGAFYGPNYEETAGWVKSAGHPQADMTFTGKKQ